MTDALDRDVRRAQSTFELSASDAVRGLRVEEKTKRFEQLLADFASDVEAREILLLVQEGVHDALGQAQRSGRGIKVVRNARKRIQRRLQALAEQDQEEVVKP